jgi:NAD(P)-dependent dehydrogenase (short-subunit alcohol dehydrogenase family)
MSKRWTNKAFVTGGSRGIGEAIVSRFRRVGYEVIAPTRRELDLASLDSIENYLSAKGVAADVLINNAAENLIFTLDKLSLPDWQRMQTINVTAPFLLMKHFAVGMARKGWGRIVNISSIYSLVSRPGRGAYAASKAGLNGLTRTAALEYAETGILVNAVCPGFVETDLTRQNNTPAQIEVLRQQVPLKRLGIPDDIASVVFYLGSEQNTFITGQTIVADGGFTAQ